MSTQASINTSSQPPTVIVESKFMQNFRVASAVNAGAGLNSIRNSSGQTEFFSIGTDQTVHNYYPDSTSDTGYSTVSLGIQASTLGVTLNSSGAIVLFAASARTLTMVTEQPGQAVRWSAPTQIPLQLPANANLIAGIFTATTGTNAYIALLIQTKSTAPGASYQLAMATMSGSQAPAFRTTSLVFSSLNCVWLGATPATMQFACVDGVLVTVSPVTYTGTRHPMQGSFKSLSVCSELDASSNSQIFSVLSDGNAYHLINVNGTYSWAQLTQGKSYTQISAEPDSTGAIHLLCVASNAELVHMQPLSSQASGYGMPTPILGNVATVAMTSNDSGQIEAFAAGTGQGSLKYLAWDLSSSNWQVESVEVQQGTAVETYTSYGSDVLVRDAAGSPLANQGVTVWASESTRVTINGATFFIDQGRQAFVSTNASGMLNIQQQTGTLSAPTLLLTVPGLMAPGDTIAISQDGVTQRPLAALTGPELLAATTDSGNPVLPDQYRTPAQADAVASAVAQTMGLADHLRAAPAATGVRVGRPRPGVRAIQTQHLAKLRQLDVSSATQAQHWRFAVVNGVAIYETLNAQEALNQIHALRATNLSSSGILDFFGTIGDIVTGVVEGVVEVVETVITVVGDVVNAAITFIVDGVQYLLEAAVSAVEQLFDVAELIFAQVKVFFETIFEWLGFLFNWGDMVLTAKALSYTVNQFMGFFQGAAGGIQRMVDNGIGQLQSQITTLFGDAINAVGNSSTGSYSVANEPDNPEVQGALSNNPMFNGLLDNAAAMAPASGSLMMARAANGANPYAAIEQSMQALTTSTMGNAAFSPVDGYFTNMGGSIDNIFSSLLQSMLAVVRDLINAVLAGVQAVVDQLLGLLAQMIGTFTAALNEDWNIPFLSPLFAWATDGMPMTTVNLISLILAIPATVLYKATFNKAPFASNNDVTAFENAWNAQTLLTASGLAPSASAKKAVRTTATGGWTGVLPKGVAPVVSLLGAVSLYFYAGFTAVTDGIPEGDHIKPLAVCAFVTEVIGQAATCPWFYAAGSIGCGDSTSAGYLNWTYANLGVALDLLYLATDEAIPSDAQAVITHIYGDVHMALSIMASIGQPASTVAANVLWCVPEMSKLLKLKAVVAATEGISLPVLAALDMVCFPVSATINTVNTIAAIPPSTSTALAAAATAPTRQAEPVQVLSL